MLKAIYDVPSAKGASLILVVPFYNEAPNIPSFIFRLKSNTSCKSLYLLGVDHNSTDNSAKIFMDSASSNFAKVGLTLERSKIPVGGIPRSKGLRIAKMLSEAENLKGRKVIFGSIDIDTYVSSSFISEARSFSQKNKEFLIFPARFDQKIFLRCVDLQKNKASKIECAKTLIGMDWLYFQLREFLVREGAIETRGSGGYFFTLSGFYKAGGHHQTFSREYRILTGENNAIGMRAKRNNASFITGRSVQTASPRRILSSIAKNTNIYGKTFKRTKSVNSTLPVLSENLWRVQLNRILDGVVFTFMHKALAYNISDKVASYFPENSRFKDLLEICYKKYHKTKFAADERSSASQQYFDIFNYAKRTLGSECFLEVLDMFLSNIPNYEGLLKWATLDNQDIDKIVIESMR